MEAYDLTSFDVAASRGSHVSRADMHLLRLRRPPYWDYSEIPFQLQRIRGPCPLDAGIAAYEQHLGLAT